MTKEAPWKRDSSSQELLRAIVEAQEVYDRRYRELVGDDAEWRNEDDSAASWATLVHGTRSIS